MISLLFHRKIVGVLVVSNLVIVYWVVKDFFILIINIRVLVLLLHIRHHLVLMPYYVRFGLNPNSLLIFLPVRFLLIFVSLTNFINFFWLNEFMLERRVVLSSLVYFCTVVLFNILKHKFCCLMLRRLWIMFVHLLRWRLLQIPGFYSINFHFLSQIIFVISPILCPIILRWTVVVLRILIMLNRIVVFLSMMLLVLASLYNDLRLMVQIIPIKSFFINPKVQVW